jgi:hypothetical protein
LLVIAQGAVLPGSDLPARIGQSGRTDHRRSRRSVLRCPRTGGMGRARRTAGPEQRAAARLHLS